MFIIKNTYFIITCFKNQILKHYLCHFFMPLLFAKLNSLLRFYLQLFLFKIANFIKRILYIEASKNLL